MGGIWCANDNMATGALQALDAAGLKGKVGVCGIDANTDIVEAIANGEATATVSSNGTSRAAIPWPSATRPGPACWTPPRCPPTSASLPPPLC